MQELPLEKSKGPWKKGKKMKVDMISGNPESVSAKAKKEWEQRETPQIKAKSIAINLMRFKRDYGDNFPPQTMAVAKKYMDEFKKLTGKEATWENIENAFKYEAKAIMNLPIEKSKGPWKKGKKTKISANMLGRERKKYNILFEQDSYYQNNPKEKPTFEEYIRDKYEYGAIQ